MCEGHRLAAQVAGDLSSGRKESLMRPRKRLAPQVESLESKALLSSSGLPVLTEDAVTNVLISINHYAVGFALDRSKSNLISNLTLVAELVPFGKRQLLPIWTKDVDSFNPKVPGSAHAMADKIKVDFLTFVKVGVASGKFVLR